MTTVAEGVETRARLDHLLREGCDESQGYLHSKPLPKAAFEKWILRTASVASENHAFYSQTVGCSVSEDSWCCAA
jgi:sensor c-di-GMP phosphodiesterase-like protein